MTLNHSSLVDEGEETRVLVTAHRREREKSVCVDCQTIDT